MRILKLYAIGKLEPNTTTWKGWNISHSMIILFIVYYEFDYVVMRSIRYLKDYKKNIELHEI
jgi:hypothetical protein